MDIGVKNKINAHYLPKWAEAFYKAQTSEERIWFLGCMVNAVMNSIGDRVDTETLVLRIRGAVAEAAARQGDFDPVCASRSNLEYWAFRGKFGPLCQRMFDDAKEDATRTELALSIPPMESSIERLELLDVLKGEFALERQLTTEWVRKDELRALNESENED